MKGYIELKTTNKVSRPDFILFYDAETKEEIYEVNNIKDKHANNSSKERCKQLRFKNLELKLGWLLLVDMSKAKKVPRGTDIENKDYDGFYWFKVSNLANVSTHMKTILKIVGNYNLHMMAHNITFDNTILNIPDTITKFGYKLKNNVYDKGRTFIADYKYVPELDKKRKGTQPNNTITMLDTSNYFPLRVAEIGEVVGYNKLDIDFENCDNDELSIYCKRDVSILYHAMSLYIDLLDQENVDFRKTVSSQALHNYLKNYNDITLLAPDNNVVQRGCTVKKLDREAYRGGRTEVFKFGRFKDVYSYDINSMYPAVMRDNIFPVVLLHTYTSDSEELYDKKSFESRVLSTNNECYIAEITVTIPEDYDKRPFLPLKYKDPNTYDHDKRSSERIIFPLGVLNITVTTPELQRIIREGLDYTIHSCRVYRGYKIFERFVTHYYNKRLEAKEVGSPLQLMYKLFLASLYGKFGQLVDEEWEVKEKNLDFYLERYLNYSRIEVEQANVSFDKLLAVTMSDKHIDKPYIHGNYNNSYIYFNSIKNKLLLHMCDCESNQNYPAIAAHVTAYARDMLYSYITMAESLGKTVLYCDTDSLFVEGKINDPVFNSIKLGELKEEKRYKELEIINPKNYRGIKYDEDLEDGDTSNSITSTEEGYQKNNLWTLKGVSNSSPLIKETPTEFIFEQESWGGTATQKLLTAKYGKKKNSYWIEISLKTISKIPSTPFDIDEEGRAIPIVFPIKQPR